MKKKVKYIRFDPRKQEVINRRVDEDIVLDIGEGDHIIGIEILDASQRVDLKSFLPANYEMKEVEG
ncbi:MAG: DUF2283 domain-containing protein [Chitinophagales bacterium]